MLHTHARVFHVWMRKKCKKVNIRSCFIAILFQNICLSSSSFHLSPPYRAIKMNCLFSYFPQYSVLSLRRKKKCDKQNRKATWAPFSEWPHFVGKSRQVLHRVVTFSPIHLWWLSYTWISNSRNDGLVRTFIYLQSIWRLQGREYSFNLPDI